VTHDWRIPTDAETQWSHTQKRLMRQERRPSVTSASQLLGPGAAPFAVLLNDWNDEAATFNGTYFTEPDAANLPPDSTYDAEDTSTWRWWLGETFGYSDGDDQRWGFQRLTRVRVAADTSGAPPVDWTEYRRRFFTTGDLVAYTAWEAV
jgi:hypothetical protein